MGDDCDGVPEELTVRIPARNEMAATKRIKWLNTSASFASYMTEQHSARDVIDLSIGSSLANCLSIYHPRTKQLKRPLSGPIELQQERAA